MLIIPVLLLIVGVPSPSNAGEICVVVDAELLAVGTACNLLHIRIRMTPTHPEKYKSPKNCYLVTWESGQGALGAWLQTRIVELEDAAAFFGPCHLGGILRKRQKPYLSRLGGILRKRRKSQFMRFMRVAADQGGGVGRSWWSLLKAWASSPSLWSLLSNDRSMNWNHK